jgi:hypothetical protein
LQVKRKELTPTTRKIVTNRKTEGFGNFLWEISLDAIDSKIKSLKKSKNPPHQNIIEGLSQIISTLDIFLDASSQDSESEEFCIKVYDAVHLESGGTLRTTKDFQGKEWFSNVAVTPADDQGQYSSDEGVWYGKVSEKLKNSKVFFFASVSLTGYLSFKRYCCCLNSFEGRLKSHMNLLLSVGMIFILQNLTFTVVHSFITLKNTTRFQLVLSTKKCILSQDLIKEINFY